MIWIFGIVITLYALPLVGMLFAVSPGCPLQESGTVYFMSTVTGFVRNLREAFGLFIVPLLTAFAIEPRRGRQIPPQSIAIIVVLAALAVAAMVAVGLIDNCKEALAHHSAFEPFKSLAETYTRELLTFISLSLGVSFKTQNA